jgi:tripartite-type tricarboxylate transporter receptor subunit TctC
MKTPGRLFACLLAVLLSAAGAAQAQNDYPNRPIRFLVGFGAGGGNDLFARLVAKKFQQIIGQTVVVENKPGAGGRIATAYAAKEPPDGYTVLVGATGQMAVATAIFPDLSYHATKSFIPLNMIASFPLVLVVKADGPIKTVQELVAWGKAHPDKSNYASSSPPFTIASELFKLKSGMPAVAIPYKSTGESTLSVLSGQTLFTITDPGPAVPQISGGKLRALAVTSPQRSPDLPNVPSMAEVGYPQVDMQLWSGFFVPTGTPAPIVAKLKMDLGQAIADVGVQNGLRRMDVIPGGPTGDAFKARIDADIEKYKDVVKTAHLTFR